MKKIITIDGPSGVGKTTIGQEIAANLKYSFFSSGKLYRYVAKYLDDQKNMNYKDIEIKILIRIMNFIIKKLINTVLKLLEIL